jgi:hypothetical protein
MTIRKLPLRWRWAACTGAIPLAVSLVTFQSVGSPVLAAKMPNRIQTRLLDGVAQMALGMVPQTPTRLHGYTVQDPPADYTPGGSGKCSISRGDNVKVTQSCLNVSATDLQGRGQAQNETAIAVNPEDPSDIVAASNDYTYGDGLAGGTVFSTNAGKTWEDSQIPLEFTRGSDLSGDPYARAYWQGGGDPSLAWDTHGNVYFAGLHFNRGQPTSDIADASSGVYVYRSTGNDGASWNMPGTAVQTQYLPSGSSTGLPLDDKPYMTIDDSANRFTDRIFVTWTLFEPDGTAYLYGAYSSDFGQHFSIPVVLGSAAGKTKKLCPNNYGLPHPFGNCNENQFSEPFFAPDGTLYVIADNYNNGVGTVNNNYNQILLWKSTNGGLSFSQPVQVAEFNDLPDCATYQGGQDAFRACVPEQGSQENSVFRAANLASGGVDPSNGDVVVTFGSYISAYSNPSTGCLPQSFSSTTGLNLYTGVKTTACSNKILESVSSNGGASFSGTGVDPSKDTVVSSRTQGTDQWFQWATFAGGILAVSYYDRGYGRDELNGRMDISLSTSSDLSAFSLSRVTSSSMPLPTQFNDSQGNSLFMGDYSGLTASANQVYPLWTDTRDPDLFDCGTNPPSVCTALEPNGLLANDQTDYTASLTP